MQLQEMKLKEILRLRFNGDKFPSGTIKDWFDSDGDDKNVRNHGSVRKQLQSYFMGDTV
jgi:hypothetical protein